MRGRQNLVMKACIFISDEGFGHIVRQRAIISELLKKKVSVTVVTSTKIIVLKEKFGNSIRYIEKQHLLKTVKNKDGSLNIKLTKKQFSNWYKNINKWLKDNNKDKTKFDFFISDLVPEAFELGRLLKIPCFGVCHFTWEWFYKKISKTEDKIYKKITSYMHKATKLYFPPFTSKETLREYKNKIFLVKFILSDFDLKKKKEVNKIKKCLIMDNGNQMLRNLISKTIPYLSKIKNIEFIIRTDLLNLDAHKKILENKNLVPVIGLKKTHEKILSCDFIIARGGYNTISESLVLKKPAILFDEKNNPEIRYNLNILKKSGLCDLQKKEDWNKNIPIKIDYFLKHKYHEIRRKLSKKKFKNTGSVEVVKNILYLVNKNEA
jgi:uncharacterized protein (TIGR00661 family)